MGSNKTQHTPSVNAPPNNNRRYQITRRVTLVGALVNLLLAALKIVFGYIGQSQALVADGIHSLSDLLSDALVLFAAKHSSRDADDNHPYGHARIETAITVALGLFLMIVAVGIIVDAIRRVIEPNELLHPGILALLIAISSIVFKEVLFHYTMRAAQDIRSNLLKANAWHHRSDAISSVIVVIGIGGTMLGLDYLDAFAAIGVALMIGKIAWDLSSQSIRELVDTALEPDKVAEIRSIIQGTDGVQQLHLLRTRRMGGDALVDVHIQVAPKLSVSEGHYISETVRRELMKKIIDISDVMVHIDPEDDENVSPCTGLPLRKELLSALDVLWKDIGEAQLITKINLHYLDGQIHVELLLPLEKLQQDPQQANLVAEQLSQACKKHPNVTKTQVLFC